MSTPVKPPGAGTGGVEAPEIAAPTSGHTNVGGSGQAKGVDQAAGEAFASSMQRASQAAKGDPSTADVSAQGDRAALLRSLAEQLRSGAIDAATAVDTLIRRSLGSSMVGTLPAGQRARLEELLRSLVANDPTLQSMQKDLTRGG